MAILPIWSCVVSELYHMSYKSELMGLLRSFTQNVRNFKKLLAAEKKFEENEAEFKKIIISNEQLLEAIPTLFRKIYEGREDNVNIDKIRKEFEAIRLQMTQLIDQYQDALSKLERLERESVVKLRATLSNINQSRRGQRAERGDEEESERGEVEIKMHEVNQQTLHYERMIEMKEKEIRAIKGRMVDALKVQQDMKGLVDSQGRKLDVAEDNIDKAKENVHQAHENLIEGRENHMASNKKKCCIFGIVIAILLAILIPILIKFT